MVAISEGNGLTVDGDPFVEIFAFRQHHSEPEVARAERRSGMLHQLILMSPLGYVLLGLEGFRGPTSAEKQQTLPDGKNTDNEVGSGRVFLELIKIERRKYLQEEAHCVEVLPPSRSVHYHKEHRNVNNVTTLLLL